MDNENRSDDENRPENSGHPTIEENRPENSDNPTNTQQVNEPTQEKEPPPLWNSAKLPEQRIKSQRGESLFLVVMLKLLRLLCFIVAFLVIVGTSILSKLTLTMMASQTVDNRIMDLDVSSSNKRFKVNTTALERFGWSFALLLTLIVPELFTFIKCVWTCIFKSYKSKDNAQKTNSNGESYEANQSVTVSKKCTYLMVFITETLHMLGICLLVFDIIPKMNSIKSVMFLNNLGILPAFLLLLSRRLTIDKLSAVQILVDLGSLVAITAGTVLWAQEEKLWLLIVVGMLISLGWWENYISEHSENSLMLTLKGFRKVLRTENKRYLVYLFISIWKIAICFVFFFAYSAATGLGDLLPRIKECYGDQPISIISSWKAAEEANSIIQHNALRPIGILPIILMAVHIACGALCYFFAVFACKICIQEFSFSFSLSISNPITIFLMSSACSWRMEDPGFLPNILPNHVFWSCPKGDFVDSFMLGQYGWIGIIWFFIQVWITLHIWKPNTKRRAATDILFVNPMYCSSIIDQSLIFNRRRAKQNREQTFKVNANDIELGRYRSNTVNENYERLDIEEKKDRLLVTVYACATMWHETVEEMMEMLKSIMRMDKYLQEQRYIGDTSSAYGFEAHVFFDDAFTTKEDEEGSVNKIKKVVLNDFVKTFVKTVRRAAAKIYEAEIRDINDYFYMVTPYGGRLVWTLPGETLLIVHAKNKDEIRHKKRWSQVMYMYYLLGYIFYDKENEDFRRNTDAAANTFVLALDGDIDFKPGAVTRLLDLMDNQNLGAACGRIHPVGSGPIVWYQKFEYAIGHWLQKATEHVTGCVLCSPGCFSLFRGSALMKVMKQYSSIAGEAKHYLQYDQGEDRWLCTLLLKEGYRIEYSAASDAYTHAPEVFKDFYIQRRRWGPSTIANIYDLLSDYKDTVRVNNSISTPYMMYQGTMMLGTVLGPGTIFLMVVGAMVAAFRISNLIALSSNLVPIIIFILICFWAKDEHQITFAFILSSLYALLMMAVIVATIIQLQEDGISSPSGIFLIALTLSFVISALMHPQEIFCVVHGFLYFLLVPSMYLLLTIYSVINMYNVSWGTREDPLQKAEEEAKAKELEEEERLKKKTKKNGGAMNSVRELFSINENTSLIDRICQCSFCTRPKDEAVLELLLQKSNAMDDKLGTLNDQVESLANVMYQQVTPQRIAKKVISPMIRIDENLEETKLAMDEPAKAEEEAKEKEAKQNEAKKIEAEEREAKELEKKSPNWTRALKNWNKRDLDPDEKKFWEEMIEEYLKPMKKDAKKEKRATFDLKELRNKVVFFFFMINALFILIVFLLQSNKDTIHLDWPVNAKSNITYIPNGNRIKVDWDYLELEPIGFVFALFFGIILILQFFGMLVHRFGTFCHIMADTTLRLENKKTIEYADEDNSNDKDFDEEPTQNLQVINGDNAGSDNETIIIRTRSLHDVTMMTGDTILVSNSHKRWQDRLKRKLTISSPKLPKGRFLHRQPSEASSIGSNYRNRAITRRKSVVGHKLNDDSQSTSDQSIDSTPSSPAMRPRAASNLDDKDYIIDED